jgi:hypothetical protein
MFAMVKAIVPRYRYDQLMRLGWKVFLPISLAMVVIVAAFVCSSCTGWPWTEVSDEHARRTAANSLLLKEFVVGASSCRCATSSSRRRR